MATCRGPQDQDDKPIFKDLDDAIHLNFRRFADNGGITPFPRRLKTELPNGFNKWDNFFSADSLCMDSAAVYNKTISKAGAMSDIDKLLLHALVVNLIHRAADIGAAYGYALAKGKEWP